jgi:hypothetical protein
MAPSAWRIALKAQGARLEKWKTIPRFNYSALLPPIASKACSYMNCIKPPGCDQIEEKINKNEFVSFPLSTK